MSAGYQLTSLSLTYTAKLKDPLIRSIANLKTSIDSLQGRSDVTLPVPVRLPRRAWRVWYLKSPFRDTIRKKHYVFQDWRYKFIFKNVSDVRAVLNAALGSAARETSSTVEFAWHFPGTQQFPGSENSQRLIALGRNNFLRKNAAHLQEKQGGWRQQYAHWNFKQYVPSEQR